MIRRLVWPLIAIALLVAAATTAPTTRSHASKPHRATLPELPYASMLVDSARSEIVLELPPTDVPAALQRGVRLRLVLGYVPASRPWPLFRAYPWVMDVQFPLGRRPGGSKAFDLPPGRTERHWESSPAVPGTILGMGGHLHDHGVSLEVKDVTTGEILWHVEPVKDTRDQVTSIPLVLFYRWYRLGLHITPRHTYRLTARYQNPTGRVLRDGGMGAVAGLFVPDRGATWPAGDPADSVYRADPPDTPWQTPEGMMGEMKMHGDH